MQPKKHDGNFTHLQTKTISNSHTIQNMGTLHGFKFQLHKLKFRKEQIIQEFKNKWIMCLPV